MSKFDKIVESVLTEGVKNIKSITVERGEGIFSNKWKGKKFRSLKAFKTAIKNNSEYDDETGERVITSSYDKVWVKVEMKDRIDQVFRFTHDDDTDLDQVFKDFISD